ncbi:MAG: pyruvate carboxylase subunit A [candidate division Zixibacteria bacterium HGW-Zixibacteria-1]|nr:MAG: pyruvate carboxylase subunit A [candidate division Zixibacteria bacterium HGW-Zixibacteria-1]
MADRYFKKILVANRGEIAMRVINACRLLGIPTLAVYSTADKDAVHARSAGEAVEIGPPPPNESYLSIPKIIDAAKAHGCDAIHPGYGFLAENPRFPEACVKAGITFIGPPADAMRLLGNKVESRIKMADAGVPLIPGMKSAGASLEEFEKAAETAGYPVLIKAAAGGGGKGMRVVKSPAELKASVEAARREAKNAFGDDTVYLEKYIENPRHIEFQVLADTHGHTMHLFERECSIQRRHQKIIEETPSTALSSELRAKMGAVAAKVAAVAGYINAGTVEFLLDKNGGYYFLEMNTRIQVEHPVTEMVTGVDLVVEQIKIAAGEPISEYVRNATQRGHAIECRIYAEDGEDNFMPSSGKILYYEEPVGPGIRVDSGVAAGTVVGVDYDPILAKLIVHAPDREMAINKMIDALKDYRILGIKTSRRFMIDVLEHAEFRAGRTYTNFIELHMGDRKVDTAEIFDLAAAVSSAAMMRKVGTNMTGSRKASQPSPWQTIGPWEIGMRIGK